jgi:segregation and condensation protein B
VSASSAGGPTDGGDHRRPEPDREPERREEHLLSGGGEPEQAAEDPSQADAFADQAERTRPSGEPSGDTESSGAEPSHGRSEAAEPESGGPSDVEPTDAEPSGAEPSDAESSDAEPTEPPLAGDDAPARAAEEGTPNAEPTRVAQPPDEADAEDAGGQNPGGQNPGSDLPDVTDAAALDAALEALLLVVDIPVGEETVADTLGQPVGRVTEALRRLSAGYTEAGRGIDLRRVGDGWRFYTRDNYAPYVEKFLLDGQRAKLTRAALETLAVIAYRQPVTRARVAAVRGVNVDGVIRTLLARGLIEETGADPDTGGILYRTTELFLERLGLSCLDQLPPLAPLLPEVDAIDDV